MSANYPCSICDFVFGNPRELGTHILTAHCNDSGSSGGGSSVESEEGDNKSSIKLITASSQPATTAAATATLSHSINNQGKQIKHEICYNIYA